MFKIYTIFVIIYTIALLLNKSRASEELNLSTEYFHFTRRQVRYRKIGRACAALKFQPSHILELDSCTLRPYKLHLITSFIDNIFHVSLLKSLNPEFNTTVSKRNRPTFSS